MEFLFFKVLKNFYGTYHQISFGWRGSSYLRNLYSYEEKPEHPYGQVP